jgi:hypothetical protein
VQVSGLIGASPGVAKIGVIAGSGACSYLDFKGVDPEHSENQFSKLLITVDLLSFCINPFKAETDNESVAAGIFVAVAK